MNSIAKLFDKLVNSSLANAIFIIIGVIVGLLVSFNTIDTKPATADDYAPLINIQDIMIDNFDTIYTQPGTKMYIHDNDILVILENDECLIRSYFSNDKKYLYTEKEDKYTIGLMIAGFIFFTFIITLSIWISIILILILLSALFEYLHGMIVTRKTYKNIVQSKDVDD